MKIAIVGAGAMGCLFGGRLARAGHDVVLVDVLKSQIDSLNEEGLLLTDEAGTYRIAIKASSAGELVDEIELLIFFTKSMHTAAAAKSIRHIFGPESWALTVQNGIGNEDAIASHLGHARLIFGMTNYPADLNGAGRVTTHGSGEVRIWAAGEQTSRIPEIAACLDRAGLVCHVDPNVRAAIWEKVTSNAVMNALSAITRLPVSGLGAHEGRENLVVGRRDIQFAYHREYGPSQG